MGFMTSPCRLRGLSPLGVFDRAARGAASILDLSVLQSPDREKGYFSTARVTFTGLAPPYVERREDKTRARKAFTTNDEKGKRHESAYEETILAQRFRAIDVAGNGAALRRNAERGVTSQRHEDGPRASQS